MAIGTIYTLPESGWVRSDNDAVNLTYRGTWSQVGANSNFEGSYVYRTNTTGAYLKFKFYGTQFRLIGYRTTTLTNPSQGEVYVDGETNGATLNSNGTTSYRICIFESDVMDEGLHTVVVEQVSNYLYIDAIDLKGDGATSGYLVLDEGQQLLNPETGWQRIEDNNDMLGYVGYWLRNRDSNTSAYSGGYVAYTSGSQYEKNKFYVRWYGTKLRIISHANTSRSTAITAILDNNPARTISMHNWKALNEVMTYEVKDLPLGEHELMIQSTNTAYVTIDCIDIDDTGYLLPTLGSRHALTHPANVTIDNWIRYDDAQGYIVLDGASDWAGVVNNIYYNSNTKNTIKENAYFKFRFYGTQFRYLDAFSVTRSSNIRVDITPSSGSPITEYTYSCGGTWIYTDSPLYANHVGQTIVYRSPELPLGYHDVVITNLDQRRVYFQDNPYDITCVLDGIDVYAPSGETPKLVPIQYSGVYSPEPTWKRYEHTSCMELNYPYTLTSTSLASSGSYIRSTNSWLSKFTFVGTKLRIYGVTGSTYTTGSNWYVRVTKKSDGTYTDYLFDEYQLYTKYQSMVVDIQGLPRDTYDVSIIPSVIDSSTVTIDCIDIDDDGYLVPVIKFPLLNPQEDSPNWQRIDAIDSKIYYSGTSWTTVTQALAYNGSYKQSTGNNNMVNFKFYGSKLRILGVTGTTWIGWYDVYINDVLVGSFNGYEGTTYYQALLYENLNMPNGKTQYDVRLVSRNTTSSAKVSIDAIDIDADGYLVADDIVLDYPDTNWVRINDNDPSIKYIGTWSTQTGTSDYLNGNRNTAVAGNKVKFYFYGSKFRIVTAKSPNSPFNNTLSIDGGSPIQFSTNKNILLSKCLVYESPDLGENLHSVEITTGDLGYTSPYKFIFDAIDLYNSTTLGNAYIVPYENRNITILQNCFSRFDDRYSKFIYGYTSKWNLVGNSSAYDLYYMYTQSTDKFTFKFKGRFLRIGVIMNSQSTQVAKIFIDGIDMGIFNTYSATTLYKYSGTQIIGLSDTEHLVEIQSTDSKRLMIDFIDIDSTGEILDLVEARRNFCSIC